MKAIGYILIGLLVNLPAFSENAGNVLGPSLGYVKKFDGIRPILGVPGAAYFAPAFALEGFEVAAVSSEHGYAVFLTPDRMSARVVSLDSADGTAVLPTSESAVNAVYLSTDGRTVALARDGSIDIFVGLPAKPILKRSVHGLAAVSILAISDDGEAIATFDGQAIVVADVEGQRHIANARAVYDLRFRQRSHDVLYADGDSVIVASPEGTRVIAGPADGISSARAATFSRDGRLVIIADTGSQDLLVARNSGGILERLKLPCEARELTSINESTFRLRCETGDQIHLVQLTPNGTRVLFIPEPAE